MTPSACPVCATDRARFWLRHAGHDLVACRECGLAWIDPLPSASETAGFYADPYEGATTGYFAKIGKKMRRARGRARHLARLATLGGRFLDVGCSGGFMVDAMQRLGFQAYGIDLDAAGIAWAAAHFPNGRFHVETVERFAERGIPMDVVYSSEVIEHVADPHAFVAAIARLLRPGGMLYITTPDIGHWRRPKDVTAWDAFNPPHHCLYFSRSSLERLLSGHGFAIVRRRPAFKPGIKWVLRRSGEAGPGS